MKSILSAALFAAFLFHFASAQNTLPANRKADWSTAGYGSPTPVYSQQVNIEHFGATGNGATPCQIALQAAISSLYGQPGTILFPAGTYFFSQPVSLPSGVVLKGTGRTTTQLLFNLGGVNADLISIAGTSSPVGTPLTTATAKGSSSITVASTDGFATGDYIKINENDAALITSAWASGSVGQLVKVSSIQGNTIHLQSALRKGYSLADAPKISRIQPITGSGIECLSIKRLDATSGQTSNIRIENAAHCWVKNIESDSSNFAHINLTNVTNIEVSGSYLHGAFGYGDGGQGYGVVLQSTSGECLVENNAFRHLRHSVLLQSGANGNVLAYNYSTEPYWSGVSVLLPPDAAGDMVLHGNWPYANLFEGNWGQNIVIDNSHGANGPFNTFFRNRAANYGLFMNTGAGDSSNFLGNEITHATKGLYLLTGNGNFEWGNVVKGVTVPALTGSPSDSSLYRSGRPGYFADNYVYPPFGANTIPTSSTILPAVANSTGNGCCCGNSSGHVVVLPVRLQQFTATVTGCAVLLQWQAMDEAGDSYTLETSQNAKDFFATGTVASKGGLATNEYDLVLTQATATAWYRLKMKNRDGSIIYSDVKQINTLCSQQGNLIILSNPVGTILHLNYTAPQAEKVLLIIADATGKTVIKDHFTTQQGSNPFFLNVQKLLPGVYYISLYKTTGQRIGIHQKMVKAG